LHAVPSFHARRVARRPHLRSLTAAARDKPDDALKILETLRGFRRSYFSASVDWSTVTPGPMVGLIEFFCRYWPLAVAGLALIRSWSSACRLSFSLSASKSALPMVQWMMPALSVR